MGPVLVAGALAGAIMGLASQAYWLVVFAYRPPAALTGSGGRSSMGTLLMFGGVLALGVWILVGALLALVFDLAQPGEGDVLVFPSIGFFFVIVFLATLALMPAMVLARTWLRHILVTYLLFTGLFGLLLPNLVMAVRE